MLLLAFDNFYKKIGTFYRVKGTNGVWAMEGIKAYELLGSIFG